MRHLFFVIPVAEHGTYSSLHSALQYRVVDQTVLDVRIQSMPGIFYWCNTLTIVEKKQDAKI